MAKHDASAEEPHDILAAEEFVVGAADPSLRRDDVHDVLAAEEFGVGAADPALRHGPVILPPDPTGITEPHDVLAAEEFAMPAAPPGSSVPLRAGWPRPRPPIALAGLAAMWLAVRRRRR
ncbi:MAG TPA: hypothetical protein VG223_09010 [Solirubrobacteraceae bacterium]|jgi:hypothetical protein|nr:hypothetical protein [Solirubrobacteraceae bacterium]